MYYTWKIYFPVKYVNYLRLHNIVVLACLLSDKKVQH